MSRLWIQNDVKDVPKENIVTTFFISF